MVRKAVFICALIASAAVSAAPPAKSQARPAAPARPRPAPPAPSLPVFEFKGLLADQTIDLSQFKDCKLKDGEQSCSGTDYTVAGLRAYISPSYYVANGKLHQMIYVFQAEGGTSLTLLQALSQKYGEPCKAEVEKWQNKAGATFDNPVWTWCFKTGKLKLHTMSFQRDYSDIWYIDDVNKPAPVPAKVDF